MNRLDRLLKKAKKVITSALYWFGEDASFIEALGLNPDHYIVPYPNGDHGYDEMKALHSIVKDVWADHVEDPVY
ncbi:hypothetical protein [Acetobacterium sp.]|uniref:hypothetical protein n=1 Tax=Acetobacterium sp. TaxID=1872094 RepID=UPI00271681DC|nr:hypothetical protein [Acetobacterium sp.]MDO9492493.1 hypothetical protein [Acetobacterium sp.]